MNSSDFQRGTEELVGDYNKTPWKEESIVYHTFPNPEIEKINHFCYKLKRHQQIGLGWLRQREINPPGGYLMRGGILADDMGLGKTIQILALVSMDKFHPDRLKAEKTYLCSRHVSVGDQAAIINDLRNEMLGHQRPIQFV